MAQLTAAERDALPDSSFAVPGKRLLPIHDRTHAELAWTQVDRTEGLTEAEREEARRRILAALKRFGVDTSGYAVREVQEAIALAPAGDVAAEKRDVRVVLIHRGLAKSGRHFGDHALADIARLAEGAQAYADHPTRLEDQLRPARSIRDIVGFYRDVELVTGGARDEKAEGRTQKADPAAPGFLG